MPIPEVQLQINLVFKLTVNKSQLQTAYKAKDDFLKEVDMEL